MGASKEVLENVIKMFEKMSKGLMKTQEQLAGELEGIDELDVNSMKLL